MTETTTETSVTENGELVLPEAKAAVRNFRSSTDIENFYRFVHENDLRREARLILELIHSKMTVKKERKPRAKKQLQ
jgi:hypothetical protein